MFLYFNKIKAKKISGILTNGDNRINNTEIKILIMELRLLVIRTAEPEKLAKFYTILGFTFDYHKHGNSPFHYSATFGQTVLEIYPLTKSQTGADKNLRLGFGIDNFDNIIDELKENNISFLLEPTQTDFGFMAIIEDPDGRKLEISKK